MEERFSLWQSLLQKIVHISKTIADAKKLFIIKIVIRKPSYKIDHNILVHKLTRNYKTATDIKK